MLQPHQLRLYGLFLAITLCFCLYSLVQERLMTRGFGPRDERFQHSLFVILVNRLVTMAVSAATLALTEQSLRPAAPIWVFSVPSLANVLASTSQYEALKYVSFPLQALAKCAKTVPVMAWGLFIGGRSYSKSDYVCSLAVTAGCAIFVLTGSIAAPSISSATATAAAAASSATLAPLPTQQQHWAVLGMALLAAFLLFDGLASTSQDRLFHSYKPMHSCNQLLWVTSWSAAFSLAGLLAGGQLAPALAFVARHPPSLGLILALSALSTAAQLFIFYTIQQYGALQFALVMTLRQFLSIVLSCLVFSHHLSPAQWAGTALVIGALIQRAQKKGGARQLKPAMSLEGVAQQDEEESPLLIPVIKMAVSQMGKRLGAQQSPRKPNNVSVDVDGRGQHSPGNGSGVFGGSNGGGEGDLQAGLAGRRLGGGFTPRMQAAAAAVSERRPKSAAQQTDSRPEGRGRGSPARSGSASLEAVGVRP